MYFVYEFLRKFYCEMYIVALLLLTTLQITNTFSIFLSNNFKQKSFFSFKVVNIQFSQRACGKYGRNPERLSFTTCSSHIFQELGWFYNSYRFVFRFIIAKKKFCEFHFYRKKSLSEKTNMIFGIFHQSKYRILMKSLVLSRELQHSDSLLKFLRFEPNKRIKNENLRN